MTIPGLSTVTGQLPKASSFVGGNVTGLLLGAALRLKAMTTVVAPVGQAVPAQELSNQYFIGYAGIPITTRKQETYNYSAEVVQHVLEDGARMSDHVILHPLRIDLKFEVSNWVEGEASFIQELLEELWKSRTPIDLITEHRIVPLMVMNDLNISTAVPEWGKLDCSATFTQVKFKGVTTTLYVEENVTPIPDKTGGPDASKSAADTVDHGKVEAADPGSLAKQLGGVAFDVLSRFTQ